ncbi:spermidine synthase [Streptomyces xiaopingdaonensis]|uniref:spermidine synthase n=1 Tax=Streptomyces xiaopingdaonensis TaxID=1565415 RepID=UPI0002DBB7E4|nr:fused MFS/spermidine synthase [Streptomyces xiaopingdaonensis]
MSEPIPVTRAVAGGTAKLLPDVDRPRAWLLTVDGAPQSYVDLDDPRHLEFEYARRVAHLLDAAAPPEAPLAALHLGAGACTLPRYLAATRPGSQQTVVDADGELLALVEEFLPLPAEGGVRLCTADARAALEAAEPDRFDAVLSDVFSGARVPAHLGAVDYVRAASRALRPGGLYVANLADAAPFSFLAPQLATVGAVFPEVCVIAEPSVLRGRRFGNVVLAASQEPLPVGELARRCAADPFPARVAHGSALGELRRGAAPVAEGTAVASPEPPAGSFSLE